ncbi:MAG TPA: OmpH family outer membrane protein [Bacteroidales bacterium]|nr:OmpH family outer membrane protein [Bacteroidales bacterium]HNS45726.1 OmpH family outer membrane protein [Bacteroidales bacterium]
MMKIIVKLMIVLTFSTLTLGISAQNQEKFGHINFADLYALMPGLDSVRTVYEKYAAGVQEQFDAMQRELETKIADYQNNQSTMSEIIRQTKEREITDLQTRMEAFQASAQQDLQNKEVELTSPIIEKAQNAVKEVAKENGYTYILNSTGGMLLFADPGDDVTELVKKKLGLQ